MGIWSTLFRGLVHVLILWMSTKEAVWEVTRLYAESDSVANLKAFVREAGISSNFPWGQRYWRAQLFVFSCYLAMLMGTHRHNLTIAKGLPHPQCSWWASLKPLGICCPNTLLWPCYSQREGKFTQGMLFDCLATAARGSCAPGLHRTVTIRKIVLGRIPCPDTGETAEWNTPPACTWKNFFNHPGAPSLRDRL